MNASEILADFVTELLSEDLKISQNKLTELIERNHALGNSAYGFLYAGKAYSNNALFHKTSRRQLHPTLHEETHACVTGIQKMEIDSRRIHQGLMLVSRGCEDEQDLRDALPNIAKNLIPGFEALGRTRNEAWTIADNPTLMQSYKTGHDLMMFYFANRIIYGCNIRPLTP